MGIVRWRSSFPWIIAVIVLGAVALRGVSQGSWHSSASPSHSREHTAREGGGTPDSINQERIEDSPSNPLRLITQLEETIFRRSLTEETFPLLIEIEDLIEAEAGSGPITAHLLMLIEQNGMCVPVRGIAAALLSSSRAREVKLRLANRVADTSEEMPFVLANCAAQAGRSNYTHEERAAFWRGYFNSDLPTTQDVGYRIPEQLLQTLHRDPQGKPIGLAFHFYGGCLTELPGEIVKEFVHFVRHSSDSEATKAVFELIPDYVKEGEQICAPIALDPALPVDLRVAAMAKTHSQDWSHEISFLADIWQSTAAPELRLKVIEGLQRVFLFHNATSDEVQTTMDRLRIYWTAERDLQVREHILAAFNCAKREDAVDWIGQVSLDSSLGSLQRSAVEFLAYSDKGGLEGRRLEWLSRCFESVSGELKALAWDSMKKITKKVTPNPPG